MDPEIILYQHNYFKPTLDRAIKITEKYVSDNKLILTGGMAIDLALRLKGESIYADDAIPDYDIVSDKNLFHATELAKILCKEKISDVNVINAVHITTIRVRYKSNVLLDATYLPENIYKQIPFLDVDHLRVIHPNYQFIDQRLSLSMLMVDTGLSFNVFNRLKKDVNRNKLLRVQYPINYQDDIKINTVSVNVPIDLFEVNDKDIFIYNGKYCIAGLFGLALYLDIANQKNHLPVTISDELIKVNMPIDTKLRLLTLGSMEPIKSLGDNTDPKKYNRLVNLKGVTYDYGNYELVDTYGNRIGMNIIHGLPVASIDYILMELLRDRIFVDMDLYSYYYTLLINIVDEYQSKNDSDDLWFPSVKVYGEINLPEYRVFQIEKTFNEEESKKMKPKTSYPSQPNCKVRSEFDHSASHYFQIDGTQNQDIVHTNYKYIADLLDTKKD